MRKGLIISDPKVMMEKPVIEGVIKWFEGRLVVQDANDELRER